MRSGTILPDLGKWFYMHGDSNKEVTEMDGYGYVFPYMKIDKGSQIIIWGAGEVGRQYW